MSYMNGEGMACLLKAEVVKWWHVPPGKLLADRAEECTRFAEDFDAESGGDSSPRCVRSACSVKAPGENSKTKRCPAGMLLTLSMHRKQNHEP